MLTVTMPRRLEMPSIPEDERLLTIDEVADYLRVTRQTVYRFCEGGQLSYFTLGDSGQRRFRFGDVRAFLRKRQGLPD
ncbi:MAG TPA: helix-turn-helix domain-containing protein [Chloroflexota bacterium]|nr:helix-turn-helix domain-containing protein [Chloroflexota bacterium]